MSKIVSFQTIQFSISIQFSSIWTIDRTLSSAITPGLSGPESDGNERVLHISQCSSITGTSPSYCFVAYLGHSLGESYLSTEKQSVYSTAPAAWESFTVYDLKATLINLKYSLIQALMLYKFEFCRSNQKHFCVVVSYEVFFLHSPIKSE